jgi:tetratricopeptide (TPR) repeat protein
MTDDIRAMTAELASDPDSLVFLRLAEALRQRLQLEAAYKVARTGAARYPDLADAHDLCARILADRGELDLAFEAWATAVRLAPDHVGANKGIAFLYYRADETGPALEHLERAASADPSDPGVAAALARLRSGNAVKAPEAPRAAPPVPEPVAEPAGVPEDDLSADPVRLFEDLEGASDGLLLLDTRGMRLAGGLLHPDGSDAGDPVAAHLAGVTREAARAARLLDLGDWHSLSAESPDGNLLVLAPTPETVLLTLRGAGVPVGRVALVADRAARAARQWLEQLG